MHKLTLATVAALLSLGASAMAETQNWNITKKTASASRTLRASGP